MTTTLPAARTQFTDGQGRPTPPFYRFLQNLKRVQDGSASDDEVAQLEQDIKTIALALGSPTGDVSDIPPFSNGNPTLQVNFPIGMQGLLQNGFAILSWLGTTTDVPEGENLYFTDARAQTAAVDNAITPGVTNKAPSEHAVAQALADLSPGVPYFIPDGETYKVADDIQALFLEPIELDGDSSLEIDGHLEDANVPDTFGKTYQAGTGISIANPTTATPTISSTLGSIAVTNDVADYASLPTNLTTADAGQYWVTRDTSMAYRWSGSAWPAEGDGISLVEGDQRLLTAWFADRPVPKNSYVENSFADGPNLSVYSGLGGAWMIDTTKTPHGFVRMSTDASADGGYPRLWLDNKAWEFRSGVVVVGKLRIRFPAVSPQSLEMYLGFRDVQTGTASAPALLYITTTTTVVLGSTVQPAASDWIPALFDGGMHEVEIRVDADGGSMIVALDGEITETLNAAAPTGYTSFGVRIQTLYEPFNPALDVFEMSVQYVAA